MGHRLHSSDKQVAKGFLEASNTNIPTLYYASIYIVLTQLFKQIGAIDPLK